MTPRVLASFCFVALLAVACAASEDAPAPDRIDPGVGVTIAGAAVNLRAALDDIEAALGAPARVLAVSSNGRQRCEWPELGLVLIVDGGTGETTGIELLPPFAGTTDDGLALGDERATIAALAYGFVREPFVGASVDRARGITLIWQSDRVERVLLSLPRS